MVMMLSISVIHRWRISGDIRSFVRGKKKGSETMSAERFKNVTSLEIDEVIRNAVPENTKKSTKFAVKIFNG